MCCRDDECKATWDRAVLNQKRAEVAEAEVKKLEQMLYGSEQDNVRLLREVQQRIAELQEENESLNKALDGIYSAICRGRAPNTITEFADLYDAWKRARKEILRLQSLDRCSECPARYDAAEAKCKRLQNFIKEFIEWKNMTPDDMDKWFERAKIMVED